MIVGVLLLTGTLSIANDVKFSNVAAGVQSMIVSFGLVLGGAWTILTFNSLGTLKKERAELEKIQRELRESAVLKINVNASVNKVCSSKNVYIEMLAEIENLGNKITTLEFNRPPFTVSKLIEKGDQLFDTGEVIHVPILDAVMQTTGVCLYPNDKAEYVSMCELEESGAYLVQFSAEVHEEDIAYASGQGAKLDEHNIWIGSKIVCVN